MSQEITRPEEPLFDIRALRLQLDQAEAAVAASKEGTLRKIQRVQSLQERLAREEAKDKENHPRYRVVEARRELAAVIGRLRMDASVSDGDIIGLRTALDRLDRAIDGESYIAMYERLAEGSDGMFHFTAPPDECLPSDLGKPVL